MKNLSVLTPIVLSFFLTLFSCKNESDIATTLINFNEITWAREIRINMKPTDKGFTAMLNKCNDLLLEANNGAINAYEYGPNLDKLVPISNFSTISYDTVTIMDPETYEEFTEIVKNELKLEYLAWISIKADMYYNKVKNKIVVKVKSVAPCQQVFDEKGNYRGSRPLIYFSVNDKYIDIQNSQFLDHFTSNVYTENYYPLSKTLPQSKKNNLLTTLLNNGVEFSELSPDYNLDNKVFSSQNSFDENFIANIELENSSEYNATEFSNTNINQLLTGTTFNYNMHYHKEHDAFVMEVKFIDFLQPVIKNGAVEFTDDVVIAKVHFDAEPI